MSCIQNKMGYLHSYILLQHLDLKKILFVMCPRPLRYMWTIFQISSFYVEIVFIIIQDLAPLPVTSQVSQATVGPGQSEGKATLAVGSMIYL